MIGLMPEHNRASIIPVAQGAQQQWTTKPLAESGKLRLVIGLFFKKSSGKEKLKITINEPNL